MTPECPKCASRDVVKLQGVGGGTGMGREPEMKLPDTNEHLYRCNKCGEIFRPSPKIIGRD